MQRASGGSVRKEGGQGGRDGAVKENRRGRCGACRLEAGSNRLLRYDGKQPKDLSEE